jgi:hydroxyacylglutathione hydrolase
VLPSRPVRIQQFVLGGLGHLSALIADESTGVAAVVDPRRDVDVYLDAASDAGVRITHVLETHLHNDYVSGGRELAALTGARHVIGAGAGLRHEHDPVRDHATFDVGRLRFTARDTPGHTPEHVAYALADTSRADEPIVLFTGGSLLVGAVGRTDLLGADNAIPFADAMFHSLHDVVLRHEDFVGVYPTHGSGSLCSAGTASTPQTTIGFERRYNPLLRHEDAESFARALLTDQPAFPRYFARMRPLNRAGPALLGGRVPERRPRPVAEVRRAVADGALVVDLRAPHEHVRGHVPRSLSIPADESFGTWLGWVVEPDRPLVLLLPDAAVWDDAIRQALRIGYDGAIVGDLDGGWQAWRASGAPVETTEALTIDELGRRVVQGGPDAPFVVDVRQASEYRAGHVPGSVHLLAADLPERLSELPRERLIATICASGFRASIGASLLRQAGFERVAPVEPGVPAWEAAGYPVER